MEERVTVYEPNDRVSSDFLKTWKVMFSNVINFRELILQLFVRDFLGSFKKSIFGIGWLFVSPVIAVVSWVFMNMTGILDPGNIGIPYPVYILFGTSCWNFFMGIYSASAGTLAAGGSIILQVKYPHEILLVKQIAQFLAGYVISFAANIIVFIVFGIIPHWQIIIFPVLVIPLLLLGSAIGLLVSVLNVVSNDIGQIVNLVLGWSLYLTPIIYSSKIDNSVIQQVIRWNPLTYLIGGVRDLVLFGRLDSPNGFILSSFLALFVFLLSWRLFHVAEQRVIEKIL